MLIKAPSSSQGKGPKREEDRSFPKADTCFFNVELPRSSSEAVMRRQLTTVIHMDWGLDGDDVEVADG